MPKELIKKYLPDPESIKNNKSLAFLGPIIHDPNLWHLNRHSVTKAFAIGLFWASIPMPLQMLAATLCAVRFKANLPLSVALVWISNPITMPPIFYCEYILGAWILDIPASPFEYELSFAWLKDKLYDIGIPLYFGSLITGVMASLLGYFVISVAWKRSIIKKWRHRQELRKNTTKT